MRFRHLGSLPGFLPYIEGHSFWRTCAYGLASDMGRSITRPKEMRAYAAAVERSLEIKENLMRAGILPYPGERKAATAPRRAAHMARVKHSVAIEAGRPAAVKPSGGLRGSTATRWI